MFSLNPSGLATGALNTARRAASSLSSSFDMSTARREASNLPIGGEAKLSATKADAQFLSTGPVDWRVKLSLPTTGAFDFGSGLLGPMTGKTPNGEKTATPGVGGLVFPYTPTINITHTAVYNPLDVVHSNYQFFSYEKSKVEAITITGDFYCEDSAEARYWVAVVHYLRSVTKMHYGNTSNAGAPPPVVKLSGYGDYVFNNIPVVVTGFTVELPKDVDYIATGINQYGGDDGSATASKVSYAPVKSTISVTVQPIYSREQVRQFDLDSFVQGNYIFDGKGYI